MPLELLFHPAVILVLGAILLPVLPRAARSVFFLVASVLSLAAIWNADPNATLTVRVMDYELTLLHMDRLSRVFGTIFALIAAIAGIYAFHIREPAQQCAALLYAAGAQGVTFAGDYFTLFVFWELMAVSSTYLVWARRTPEAEKAGMRYLLVHIFGGGLLFIGILLHFHAGGDLLISRLYPDGALSSYLILAGVALNAAVPPLHAWLADAYPKATVTGAVFLSALTTKTAVYVLVRVFPGWELLLILGVMMTLYGVVFAILANDTPEILAYHIVSQVGYMVAGVGIGTEMALNGTTAHAYSHILYKALLFMGAGVVLQTTGKSRLTELGGLAKAQPLALWLYMVGALSIAGAPLFNGFISKGMVVAAAGEAHLDWAVLLMLLASVGTFLSVGLKLPYLTWFGEDRGLRPDRAPRNMLVGMGVAAMLCFLYGIAPSLLYRILPFPVDYNPYTVYHLVEATQILIFTFVGFWIVLAKMKAEAKITLDTDWFYRRSAAVARRLFVDRVESVFDRVESLAFDLVHRTSRYRENPIALFDRGGRLAPYNPDTYRPSTQLMIGLVLLSFVLLVTLGLIAWA